MFREPLAFRAAEGKMAGHGGREMMGFAQGRLDLDTDGQALLSELLASLNRATRTVLARSLRDGIDRREIREPLALESGCFPEALASAQRRLALRKAGDLRKTAQAKDLWAGRERLEIAKACGKKIARKREEIAGLRKEMSALRKSPLARPEARRNLAERILRERQGLAKTLERKARLEAAGNKSLERAKSGDGRVCFGGRNLLGQRERIGPPPGGPGGGQPSERNGSPFATLGAWESAWSEARDGAFLLEGSKNAASRNDHAKFGPATGILRIRLTEAQAERRMEALARERGIPLEDFLGKIKYSPLRMACRFLEARLEFRGKRQEARLARLASILEAEVDAAVPVSWRIGRETIGGKTVFQARAQWLEPEPEAKDWGLGALGADINAWGIAWAAAKSDGNLARPKTADGLPCFGSISVRWGETSEQATHAARIAAKELVALAKERSLPIVLEDLDFAAKKRSLRYEEGARAKALSGFAYRKLIESIRARAAKEGVPVRFACPSWTSVLGFAKYGRRNGLSPDQAAALAIARKGLGLKGTAEKAVRRGGEKIVVLNRPERIRRSWMPALPPRSRGKGTEPETPGGRGGRAAPLEALLSAFLGVCRRDWGARLKSLDSPALARATAGFPEGLTASPDPKGAEGREAAARGPSRPRSAKLKLVKISRY